MKSDEGGVFSERGSRKIHCSICGKPASAVIEGKAYCYECGSKIVRERLRAQLEELRRRGVVSF
ncbi:MAG: hypothetical protein DRJ52_00405 [Thermoprotei archaeon]|nr:MAG: hypothetical protein DRJ52_00405 [Thermoprotei archaeon]RLF00289.1 MAG: hypothetical protein DRJ63_02830 [Thermoprotei archaeon]HDI75178.1 hypothetical protein [Thermoprotei archaeon]